MYPMLPGAVNEQAKRVFFGWQTFNRNGCFNSGCIRGTGFSFRSGWLQWSSVHQFHGPSCKRSHFVA